MKKKKSNFKQISLPCRVLYYWEKLLGINPLILSESNKINPSIFGIFYACLLITVYSYTFYTAMFERLTTLFPGETAVYVIVDFMEMCWRFFEMLSTWIISALYQNRIKLIVKSFMKVEKISRKLDIPDEYEKVFTELSIQVTGYNLLFLSSLTFAMIMWNYFDGFNSRIWVSYAAPTLVPFNMILLFVWSLTHVKRKFCRLNEKLRDLMQNENLKDDRPGLEELEFGCDTDVFSKNIEMISQLHRELRHIVHCIEKHFALPILCIIVDTFMSAVLNVYGLYSYMKISESLMDLYYLALLHHWLLRDFGTFIFMSIVCGSTSIEVPLQSFRLISVIVDY